LKSFLLLRLSARWLSMSQGVIFGSKYSYKDKVSCIG
jgi:hypothetical protein